MDLLPILARAESLFHRFGRSVEAIDKKGLSDLGQAMPTRGSVERRLQAKAVRASVKAQRRKRFDA